MLDYGHDQELAANFFGVAGVFVSLLFVMDTEAGLLGIGLVFVSLLFLDPRSLKTRCSSIQHPQTAVAL